MEVTWVNPMEKSLWSIEGEPYQNDLSEPNGILPMSWVSWTLSNWLEWYQWESPYELRMNVPIKLTWVNPMGISLWVDRRCTLWEWLEWKWKWISLSKWWESIRNEWIEVNRMKWSEMSEMMDLTWTLWKWARTTLWELPYELIESVPMEVTWDKPYENVPIKMMRIDEKWMNWSE